MISSIRLDLLAVLGDDYIAQHISQAYRAELEQRSYKVYMSNMAANLVSVMSGQEIAVRWSDILTDLDGAVKPEEQTETEAEIKTRLLAKLNGKGGE